MKNIKQASIHKIDVTSNLNLLINAVDATTNGIVITDCLQPDNPIIFCNRAFEFISGYTRDEIIGRNCRFLQGDDRDQEARRILRESIEKGIDCKVELRNYKKDGSLFWNELMMSPVRNKKGDITHFIGVQNDITRRKKAEAALKNERESLEKRVADGTQNLKESEAFLTGIFETMRESLLVLDKSLNVISANKYFYSTFKVSKEETVGVNIFKLGNGQWDIKALRDLFEKILPEQNPFENFEVEHNFPQIGKKVMLLNARQIEALENAEEIILLAIEDITELREVQIRKDDFLSIASHELKTPVTSIKAYLQVLEILIKSKKSTTEKNLEIIEKTNVSLKKLESLISDLLDVSKIQAGKIEYKYAEFDVNQMIKESIDLVQSAAKHHTIKYSGDLNLKVNGDKERLEMVLNNLLNNAIKYSPNGKDVVVHASRVSDYLKIMVTDQGIGINKKDQQKLFERFFRVEDAQKQFAGMGIGLYISEQIVVRHGGHLWVDSEPGKGSTFSFTIPLNNN
ncbi:MAG: PAS domain S-box protein [Patescibacteria group bacterium]